MNLLKSQWERISQQLGALSATQRLIVGLLMAVLVLTLMYTYKYVGQQELVSVLNQPTSPEERSRMAEALKAAGETVTIGADGTLKIAPDRQYAAMALLGTAKALPSDISTAMDRLSASENLFDTPSKTEDRKRQLRELQLMKVLSSFPGVESAQVLLDMGGQRGLMSMKEPTASIMLVTTKKGGSNRELANSAADLVRCAVSGLRRSAIMVAVNGNRFVMKENEEETGGAGGDFDEIKAACEDRLAKRVIEQLHFFGDVLVTVTVDVNRKLVTETRDEVDPKKFLHKEVEMTNKATETTGAAPTPTEPGVVPNTSTQVAPSAGGGGGTTMNDETTKYMLIPSTSKTESRTPPGEVTPKAASVRVPESYFIAIWKKKNPTATKEPEQADIQPMLDAEIPRITKDVMGATGLLDDKFISVQLYSDTALAPVMAASAPGVGIGLPLLGEHGKELAVGALALVSLFMVANLAKKSAPVPAVAAAAAATTMNQKEGPPVARGSREFLSGGETMAGQVGEDADALSAIELDPEEVKTEQMQSQVADMVTANPDAATTLITRWLDRD
jgi:flagellar M-ring protein FliF